MRKSFNSKIKYLVSKDVVTDLKRQCCDKLKAKDYVLNCNVSNLIKIPEVLRITGDKLVLNEIDFTQYEFPLYIKCNHGCRYQIYCNNIDSINRHTESIINKYMSKTYTEYNEYQYDGIDKKIYLEKYIKIDYLMQFYCFHGEPLFLECIKKNLKTNDSIFVNEYNINYEPFRFTNSLKLYDRIPKPSFYEELVENTKKLSKDFDFVRVDYFIDINNNVYFSELTFSPSAGHVQFKNKKMDNYFGSFLKTTRD